jgi:hypothetical protein
MDKLTSINWIVDAIDNTILWMFLIYLIDICSGVSPTLPSFVHILRAKVETHLRSSPLSLFGGDPTLKHPSRIPAR